MEPTLYEEWLLGEGLEDSTIMNYRGKLDRVYALVSEQGWEIEALTASQLRWVADQFPQTRSTLGQLKAAMRHYYLSIETQAPVGAIRLPKRGGVDDYKGLEDDEAAALETAALGDAGDAGRAVMALLYLGLRRGELVRIHSDDFKGDWVDILGKGNKRRWVPVHPTIRHALPDDGWMFPGRWSGHVHHGTVYLWVQRIADEAGLGHVHPHALRHTCLTRLYEQTGDIRLVQAFAGHSDPATTAKYTRVARNRLAEAVVKLDYQAVA